MKRNYVFLVILLLLCMNFLSVAQKAPKIEYYTVLPQTSYALPESTTILKTTICTTGTDPGFGQELNSPGFNGVAGSRSYHVNSYPPPDGYIFYKMTIQLSKNKEAVSFDINKTYIVTKNGYKAFPYYALPVIIGSITLEEDLAAVDSIEEPFLITFPQGKKQKYVDIWYAIPKDDTPVTYQFYESQCEVTKYEKK